MRVVRQQQLDGVEGCIDRPVAGRSARFAALAVDVERQRRRLRTHVAGDTVSDDDLHAVVHVRDALIDERLDVLVVDVLLAVGERLEAHEGVLHGVVAEL